MVTSTSHLAALLALLLSSAQADAHRYRTHHHHHGRRLFKPAFEMANVEAFRPFHASTRANGGLFTSAGPLVDVFQEVMGDVKRVARELSDSTPAAARTPPHEVVETEDAAILSADLPGCKKEDVDAQVSEDGGKKTLTITAVRKKPLPAKNTPDPSPPGSLPPDERTFDPSDTPTPVERKENPPASSSSSSSPSYTEERFKLSFHVGEGVDVSAIRGSLEDGVLTLVLPKIAPEPPAEPIEIPIDFAAGSRGGGETAGGGGGAAASFGRGRVPEETGSAAAEADTHISLS